MIEKMYINSDDVNVAARRVYGKANDAFAYSDSDCKSKIACADLKDAYVKGMLIDVAGVLYKPVSCSVTSNVTTITYVTADGGSPTTAKLATIKSSEK